MNNDPLQTRNPTEASFRLDGKVAVILGGTSGLGRSIAEAYVDSGALVTTVGRRENLLQKTVEQLKQRGGQAVGYSADIQDLSQLENLTARVKRKFGRVDILVNSAGIHKRSAALDVEPQEWDQINRTNLRGTFFASQIFGRAMIEQGEGCVINITSLAAYLGIEGTVAYAASKAGVSIITQTLASEWGPLGVRVNALAPGVFQTPLNKTILVEERLRKILQRTPAGRLGERSEIRGAAVFLASPAASFVNGVILPVDGGFLARGF